MKFVGAHVAGYPAVSEAPVLAQALGATAFALNLSNESRYTCAPISDAERILFIERCETAGFTSGHILPHAAFVINLCSPDSRKLHLSRKSLTDEMKRAASLGLSMVNFHPGATLNKIAADDAIKLVAESINEVLSITEGVTAVIENTAGQGSSIGYSFEQLAAIINYTDDRSRVGVCIDTAHAFAAGYHLETSEGFTSTWDEFSSTVGFRYLRGMHLNDSQRPCGSRIDRHAPLGQGAIGIGCFEAIMRDHRFNNIPLILETPDQTLWQQETAMLNSVYIDNN